MKHCSLFQSQSGDGNISSQSDQVEIEIRKTPPESGLGRGDSSVDGHISTAKGDHIDGVSYNKTKTQLSTF